MKVGTSDRRVLHRAYLTEAQAIAIYQAECWILRRSSWTRQRKQSLELFEETLREECEHQNWMEGHLQGQTPSLALRAFNTAGGHLLGCFLGLIPSRLSWYLHTLAESQAEAVYRDASEEAASPELRTTFLKAAEQERSHVERFKRGLSNAQAAL